MWRKLRCIAAVGGGIGEGLADGVLVGEGGNGADLGEEDGDGFLELGLAVDLEEVGVIAGHRVDHGGEDGHGVRVVGESLELVLHALVEQLVLDEEILEALALIARGEASPDDEIGGLDEIGFFGDFLDVDAAVAEDARLAIDEGDVADAGAGVAVAIIEGDIPGERPELGDVDRLLVFSAGDNRQLGLRAIDDDGSCFRHSGVPLRFD